MLWVDAAVPHSVLDDDDFLGTGQRDINPLGPQGRVGMVLSQPPLKQSERVDHVAVLVQAGNLVPEDGISWLPGRGYHSAPVEKGDAVRGVGVGFLPCLLVAGHSCSPPQICRS
jgi:hypothetical protein